MGFTSRFLTLTKGTGLLINLSFLWSYTGDMEGRRNEYAYIYGNGKSCSFCSF